ncbi:hypothetical protein ENBRE01_1845 [Enteropsectra breve]|nr:hypothetical protein ENBRE01_1845 [Enteropsectra breve]
MRWWDNNKKLFQSYFAETLCTFIFGYAIYSTTLNLKYDLDHLGESVPIGLAICFSGIALIYTFADHTISHFNPAITLAAMLTFKLDFINGLGFIIFQIIGFILAALMAVANFPGSYMEVMRKLIPPYKEDPITNVNIFFTEFVLTAILVFVVFMVGINAFRDPEHSLYGDEALPDRTMLAPLTIGLTLGFLAFLGGKTSGSYFNPGLIFAPMLLCNDWPCPWQYFVSEFTGGLVGALIQVWILFK